MRPLLAWSVLVVLSGCGDDDDSSSGDPDAAASDAGDGDAGRDAGARPDAGTDAGGAADAGSDGGGGGADAGDADAGGVPDGGGASDAGPGDAGAGVDGGPCGTPDRDGDGHDAVACGGDDCDDEVGAVHPGVFEEPVVEPVAADARADAGTTWLVLDADDAAHIAYECGALQLCYATNVGGAWDTEVVGGTRVMGEVGLALDSTGTLHASYYDDFDGAAPSVWHAERGAGGWSTDEVESDPDLGLGTGVAVAAGDVLHVCATRPSQGDVHHATDDGGGWVVDPLPVVGFAGHHCAIGIGPFDDWRLLYLGGSDLGLIGAGFLAGLGQTFDDDAALAIDSAGASYVSSYDNDTASLWVQSDAAGAFANEEVDPEWLAGSQNAITVTAAGAVHVTYRAGASDDLRVASRLAQAWVVRTVDDEGDTGYGSSVRADSAGLVHASYTRADTSELLHATFAAPDGRDDDCDGVAW